MLAQFRGEKIGTINCQFSYTGTLL